MATGLAQEKENSSFINKTSFVENCETSAWGRALGNLGIGIDTAVASAEEVKNAILNQEIDNADLDIIEGLKSCDTLQNAIAYKDKYKSKVKDIENFKKVYAKIYHDLLAKEESNAA